MVHGRGEATTLTAYAGDMAEVRLIEAGRDRSLVHQQELLHRCALSWCWANTQGKQTLFTNGTFHS